MRNNSIYLDCTTGISGDMLVAALLDLGADRQILQTALDSIQAEGFEIRISKVLKSGIEACDFEVILDEDHHNHDHDMEFLFGTEYPEKNIEMVIPNEKDDETENHHSHEHGPDQREHHQNEQGHSHAHRHLQEINEIIDRCRMSDGARMIAKKTFRILAEAEAEAHHATPESVGFHEAGAVDSIVDIIAASVCMDMLAPEKVFIPVLFEGRGTVRCQHGVLPVPVPAVVNILSKYRIPLHIANYRGEYVTPTGAAFAAAVATDYILPEKFRILKTGTGAGKRAYAVPGMLRAMIIDESPDDFEDRMVRLESNIDDSTGEEFGYLMEKLFEAGARDVHYFPVFMKKNRPAYQLNVICLMSEAEQMERIIFHESSTIGIRRILIDRTVLPRKICPVETSLGKADVKVVEIGEEKRYYPEYRSAAEIASEKKIPLREVMRIIEKEAAERDL